jgi:hypothetical protein
MKKLALGDDRAVPGYRDAAVPLLVCAASTLVSVSQKHGSCPCSLF